MATGTYANGYVGAIPTGAGTAPNPLVISVSEGGTGATTSAGALTNLSAGITEYTDTETSTSTTATITQNYTVAGYGFVIASCSIQTDSTSDVGNTFLSINRNEVPLCSSAISIDTARAYGQGASGSVAFKVSNGDVIRLSAKSTKSGTKTIYRTILAFGCTLTTA